MAKSTIIHFLLFLGFIPLATNAQTMGADRLLEWKHEVINNRVGIVVNQTSCLSNGTHLLEALLEQKVNVTTLFAPEHGFRGTVDAGETVKDGKDTKTNIPIVSLYGQTKKPTKEMLQEVDLLIFDIQDVGARFYTYTSTLYYIMVAAAENGKKVIVLDRPNPNDTVDGPLLYPKYKSFVGLLPIPVLHGVTVGELAKMIQGEEWLATKGTCDLTVIPMKGWRHGQLYRLPIKPSPNLPNDQSIALYPSLCFFEGTQISVGRGTEFPFQMIGAPHKAYGSFQFTPTSKEGFDKKPLHKDKTCYGIDLRRAPRPARIELSYLIGLYQKSTDKKNFFLKNNFIDLLAGSSALREQIIAGKSEKEIRQSWQSELKQYRSIRKKYLLYEDYTR